MKPVEVVPGDGPIVLGVPHSGTYLPADIYEHLNQNGRELADTDWHIDRLYDGLLRGATTVRATFHRYVIDANRNPAGDSLYPGQNTTGLVPLTDFDGVGIWDRVPDAGEVAERCVRYHAPYHAALAAEMERVRAVHGVAILYDCHSIRSRIPFLFDGALPDLNVGTNLGATCSGAIESEVVKVCTTAKGYTSILNGRFKGGWTTRHYGQPDQGWHAVQMELAQSAYLAAESAPWDFDEAKAAPLRPILRKILESLNQLALTMGLKP